MNSNAGHVMNLANSIIGVGLLAMPFCFKQCGIALAIVMLILSSLLSRLACQFLIKSSILCRKRNFEFLAFYAFGSPGKLLVELGIIGFMMGTCVAFFVVMGDLGPAILSRILNVNNNGTLRTSVLIALGILVILPLGLLRNIESLVAISTATIGFYFLFTLKIFLESLQQLLMGDWWYHVKFWNPEGILQCIPIFAMSLSCQMQLFEIYESIPAPSSDKINSVVHFAINLCTLVYASVGFLGYIAYCKGTFSGNILLSFTPSLSSEMFKLGFVMSIAVSFPLVIFPCRASLYSLIFRRVPIHHEVSQTSSYIPDSRFKWLTITIVMVSLGTGLLIPSIELVLGFVGSTIGIAICVIFPSLSYLNLNSKNSNDKTVAKVTVVLGFLIMVMGTLGNFLAAIENNSAESAGFPPKFNPSYLDNSKIWPDSGANIQFPMNNIKKVSQKDVVSVKKKNLLRYTNDVNISKDKKEENRRKEPPVPVAPVLKEKEHRKLVASEVSEDTIKKMQRESKTKTLRASNLMINSNISKDALEKEEKEIVEIEKDKELLRVLKEQHAEQKKLLQKQEKILLEMKNREIKNEEKLNKILKEKSMEETLTVKSEAFNRKFSREKSDRSIFLGMSKFNISNMTKINKVGNTQIKLRTENLKPSSKENQNSEKKKTGADFNFTSISEKYSIIEKFDSAKPLKIGKNQTVEDGIVEKKRGIRQKRNANEILLKQYEMHEASKARKCNRKNNGEQKISSRNF